jgi:hypothetical protein
MGGLGGLLDTPGHEDADSGYEKYCGELVEGAEMMRLRVPSMCDVNKWGESYVSRNYSHLFV